MLFKFKNFNFTLFYSVNKYRYLILTDPRLVEIFNYYNLYIYGYTSILYCIMLYYNIIVNYENIFTDPIIILTINCIIY